MDEAMKTKKGSPFAKGSDSDEEHSIKSGDQSIPPSSSGDQRIKMPSQGDAGLIWNRMRLGLAIVCDVLMRGTLVRRIRLCTPPVKRDVSIIHGALSPANLDCARHASRRNRQASLTRFT